MSDPFLAAIDPDCTPAVRPTPEEALRLLVADIRSLGEPPAQLLVALAKAEEALDHASPRDGGGRFWRHIKRGTIYEEVGRATLQRAPQTALGDGTGLVVYRGANGMLWAREEREFGDGRFEPVMDPPGKDRIDHGNLYRAASLVLREVWSGETRAAQDIAGHLYPRNPDVRDRHEVAWFASAFADAIDAVAAREAGDEGTAP